MCMKEGNVRCWDVPGVEVFWELLCTSFTEPWLETDNVVYLHLALTIACAPTNLKDEYAPKSLSSFGAKPECALEASRKWLFLSMV